MARHVFRAALAGASVMAAAIAFGAGACSSFSSDPAEPAPEAGADAPPAPAPPPPPPPPLGPADASCVVSSISASNYGAHACALKGGAVWCWGYGSYGQLGTGRATANPTPTPVPGITDAVEIAVGRVHTCARLADGRVTCWGSTSDGQLGDGTPPTDGGVAGPVVVANIDDATAIAAGALFSCAIRGTDHSLWCWGHDGYGELGLSPQDGGTASSATPRRAAAPGKITAVAAGAFHACATNDEPALYCWGLDNLGQAGVARADGGDAGAPLIPTRIVSGAVGDITGGVGHTCAVLEGGLACWGDNADGQLGAGNAGGGGPAIVPVASHGVALAKPSAGGYHTCAVDTKNAQAWCWGLDNRGQCAVTSGGPVDSTRVDASGVAAVAAGQDFTCALGTSGPPRCWGGNHFGQLGRGDADEFTHAAPEAVRALCP